jgi:hypothetical protein
MNIRISHLKFLQLLILSCSLLPYIDCITYSFLIFSSISRHLQTFLTHSFIPDSFISSLHNRLLVAFFPSCQTHSFLPHFWCTSLPRSFIHDNFFHSILLQSFHSPTSIHSSYLHSFLPPPFITLTFIHSSHIYSCLSPSFIHVLCSFVMRSFLSEWSFQEK